MAYPETKTSPNGTPYTITNLWDDLAFQLISAKESIFAGVKSTVSDVVTSVTKPIGQGLSDIGKGLTSWLPIVIVAIVALGVFYFIFMKPKGKPA